jgi:hypothetical protein
MVRGGKGNETNVRALLISLDAVLSEIWRRMEIERLAELVTPATFFSFCYCAVLKLEKHML